MANEIDFALYFRYYNFQMSQKDVRGWKLECESNVDSESNYNHICL